MRSTLFNIGPFPIRSFGVKVLIGFLLGIWYAPCVARRRMAGRKSGEPGAITSEHVFDKSLIALFVCIIGAHPIRPSRSTRVSRTVGRRGEDLDRGSLDTWRDCFRNRIYLVVFPAA